MAPVVFAAGAIGNDRELAVSPQHRMLVSGPMAEALYGESEVMVPAKSLINDSTIRARAGGTVGAMGSADSDLSRKPAL